MPMLDAFIPDGALSPDAERRLLSQPTDLLLKHEGADPENPVARSIAWLFLHRPTVFVGGSRADEPRYRIIASVPEGQFNDERRQAVVAAMTDAVLDAEGGAYQRSPDRVWVITNEIPDGTWGGRGRINRLADIAALVRGDEAAGRQYASEVLGRRRREQAAALLAASREAVDA